MPRSLLVALMLAIVYVVWGSTAPAMKLAVATLPPWWMASLRFGAAGTILWLFCRLRGTALPSRKEWWGAALVGTIMLVGGNGAFAWTLQYLPSGIGALFFALSPLWMAIIGWFMYRERLSPLALAGLLLGLAGMVYLYSPSGAQDLPTWPTVVGVLCSIAWAFGSMLQRRFTGSDLVQQSSLQMLSASLVLAFLSLASGERLSAAAFSPTATWALVYLVLLGSIVGFSAFLWIVRNVPTTLASTYSYANPVVALVIGIDFLHEPFSWHLLAGAGVILLGVALMIAAPKPATVSA
ncbi:MAG TPA: EamA family transporter [Candidatus Baltobacteraceae bacterium]|nr:EamA family transporter [Candidatus Baltobacteraceae bacterium]